MTDEHSHGDGDPGAGSAAALVADLADVLLPGGDGWPSGSAAGVHGVLAERLEADSGGPGLASVAAALVAAGAPFAGRDEAARIAIVSAFEAAAPALFGIVRDAAFLAYYESPFVVAAINDKGFPYLLRPHLDGYPLRPFDPALDAPRHGRGRYVATEAVRRLDIGGLELETRLTTKWGLAR